MLDPIPSGTGSSPPAPPRQPLPAAWVVLPFLVCGALLLLYRGFAGDDTFIHLRYARNISQGNGFVFNPGEASYGSTGPLWTLLVAGAGGLLDGRFLLAAKILGWLSTLLGISLFLALARQLIAGRLLILMAAIGFAADPWLAKWGGSGMETPLAVCIALAAALLHLRRREQGGLPASAFVLGLGTLVRPELIGLFLVGLFDRVVVLRRPAGETVASVLLFLVPVMPWLLYARSTFGDVIPATVHAKAGHMARAEIVLRTAKILGLTYGPVVLAGLGVLIAAMRRDAFGAVVRRWLRRRTVLWGWAIGLPVAFLVTRSYVASRYLLPVAPFLVLIGFAGIELLVRPVRLRRGLAAAALVALLALSAAVQLSVIYPRTRFTRGVDENLIQVAEWVRDNTPPDALIAVHEVGAVGYYCDRRVIDTAGLVTPIALPYVREYRIPDLFRDFRPGYYVSSGDPRTDRQVFEVFRDRMTLLFERPVQRGGSAAIFAHPLPVGVYRVDWADDREGP